MYRLTTARLPPPLYRESSNPSFRTGTWSPSLTSWKTSSAKRGGEEKRTRNKIRLWRKRFFLSFSSSTT